MDVTCVTQINDTLDSIKLLYLSKPLFSTPSSLSIHRVTLNFELKFRSEFDTTWVQPVDTVSCDTAYTFNATTIEYEVCDTISVEL